MRGSGLHRRRRGQRHPAALHLGAHTVGPVADDAVDGYAVKVLLLSPILVDYVGNLLRVPVMLPFALRDRRGFLQALREQWKPALVVATLGPASYVMVLYALTMAPLSHVAPAREVSMLFAALMGGHLLAEGDRALRVAGAVAIALGVAGLALG